MLKIVILFIFSAQMILANISGLSMNGLIENTQTQSDKKSYQELINFLSQSTRGDHTISLAIIYLNGISDKDDFGETVQPDIQKAIKYFEKAINLEYYEASAMLGSLYLYDSKLSNEKDNVKKAKYYLELALEKGVYEASTSLANIYFYYDKDIKKAMSYLHIGANKNIASSELALATLYGYGSKEFNIKKDLLLGNQFLERACLNKNKTEKVEEFCSSKHVLNYKKEVNN